jgi:glycosyltransferase involved in cell wall biosynthesis
MKILFVGPLHDMSGFAHSARNLLQALIYDSRLDVVARKLTYDQLDSGQKFLAPEWLKDTENKDLLNIDICLQMVTCNIEAQPVPGIPNGLYTFFETDKLQPAWAAKAQEFDFLVVPSKFNAETLIRSGVTKPILVASPPCDKDVYFKGYEPFNIESAGKRTVFYNICQLSTKKGIDLLLRAYYAAFAGVPDDVLLVLKTYINMYDRTNDLEIVKQYINSIKTRARIPIQKFPPVLPIIYTMTDDEINGLHTRGDCYVNASRAEGWCIPVFDALAHGKTVISHTAQGLGEFVTPDNALVYGGCQSLFFDMPHPDPGLFTGLERCFEPSVAELALNMQKFYLLKQASESGQLNEPMTKEWQNILARRDNGRTLGSSYDYRVVSDKIVEQLIAVQRTWKETGVARFAMPEA